MTAAVQAYSAAQVYRRLLRYARPHAGMFAIGILGMAMYAAVTPITAWFVKKFLNAAFVSQNMAVLRYVPAGVILTLIFLPYIDRNPATAARHRKVAIVIFSALLLIAVVLTVIGTFFRGPGWEFIAPWTHWYVEF